MARIYEDCEDTNNGARDSYYDDCTWYNEFPSGCGYYDDDDFTSLTMCCACADYEQEIHYQYASDVEIDGDFIDSDLEADQEEVVPVFDTTDGPLQAEDIQIEDLQQLDEEGWNNFVQEQVDPFDPAMDWAEIVDTLDEFQQEQEGEFEICADTMEDFRD